MVSSFISPIESLAFSMQANPGVYAVLAGSGVSRAAQIPTGWEITLHLVRRLAAQRGEECAPDPEQWYRTSFNTEPDYSDLLGELCHTPTERQQLLRGYMEPNAEEREEGIKQPTAAHHAIAALAEQGFIRVVLTTNFDRLLETALDSADVNPVVLSRPDQVEGALPLIHTRCCVVKLHGDYRDPDIRNTRAELEAYDERFSRLLDRVFDEFGLVVCGWSAAWDVALRNALFRARSRRFTTFWASQRDGEEHAQQLIDHRRAERIRITDADDLFRGLQDRVESLHEFARPHPVSTAAAVASLRRYLSEPRYRIRMSDLVDGVVEQVVESVSGEAFGDHPRPAREPVTARVRGYEAACSTLLALAPVAGFWAEEQHTHLWQRALSRLGTAGSGNGYEIWIGLRRYPAALLLYSLGVGAVAAADGLPFLRSLLETPIQEQYREDRAVTDVLPPFCLFGGNGRLMRLLEGMEDRHAPLNDWMHDAVRPHAARVIAEDFQYTLAWDTLEILIALSYLHRHSADPGGFWLPAGCFGYREPNRTRILQQIEASLSSRGNESPYVACGIFGDTAEVCGERLTALRRVVVELHWR